MQKTRAQHPVQTTVREAIAERFVTHATARFAQRLRAVILTGSLARNEATIVERDGKCELLGDAEFVVVFHRTGALASAGDVEDLCSNVSRSLEQDGIRVDISMAAVAPEYLSRLTPAVFSYELRECGRTVWGDPDDLLRIPAIASSGILREDAWRLLCNRMVEVMEMAVTSPPRNRFLSVAFRYRVIKLFLDMATSYLVFIGEYAPSYRKRQEAISRMEHCDNRADIPFDVARFRRMVETCTAWKLDCHCPRLSWDEWMYAVDTAHSLWRWETALLCNTDPTAPDETLMRRCMKRQPMAGRVRGWLYVLRCRGWLRSWNHWARWATMACLASPRYWTYAAATALFFRLPELMEADTNADLPGPRQPELPLHVARTPLRGWRAKAEEIALNYHTLLEKTRT